MPRDIHLASQLNPNGNSVSRYPAWDGIWRLTEIIGCPAAPLHRALGCPSSEIDAQTTALFYEGILHENDLKARIRDLGYIVFEYPDGVRANDVPVICHPDGNFMGDEILETKSFVDDDMGAANFVAKHPQYVKQVMGYERILEIYSARIIAKNRDNGWILDDIVIDYDPAIIDPIWQNVTRVNDILQQGIKTCSGPWFPRCSDDFMTRLFCPFNGAHCKRSEADTTVEINDVLQKYAKLRPAYDEAHKMVNEMRDTVKGLLEEAGLKRARALDGTLASLYDYHFTSADEEYAKKVLDKTTFERIFKRGSTPSVRITLPKGNGA